MKLFAPLLLVISSTVSVSCQSQFLNEPRRRQEYGLQERRDPLAATNHVLYGREASLQLEGRDQLDAALLRLWARTAEPADAPQKQQFEKTMIVDNGKKAVTTKAYGPDDCAKPKKTDGNVGTWPGHCTIKQTWKTIKRRSAESLPDNFSGVWESDKGERIAVKIDGPSECLKLVTAGAKGQSPPPQCKIERKTTPPKSTRRRRRSAEPLPDKFSGSWDFGNGKKKNMMIEGPKECMKMVDGGKAPNGVKCKMQQTGDGPNIAMSSRSVDAALLRRDEALDAVLGLWAREAEAEVEGTGLGSMMVF